MQRWLRSVLGRIAGSEARRLDSLRYVVLDTEMTSLDSKSNRLLSVGAIAMDGGKIRLGEQFYRVVNPRTGIPAETIIIHGLRPADVAVGDAPELALRELKRFIGEAVIVGHFVHVDMELLRKEMASENLELRNDALDTARSHHWLAVAEARRRGLDEVNESLALSSLAARYGIRIEEAHHALHDAFVTAQLWQQLLPKLIAHGIITLQDALRVQGDRQF